MDRSVGETTPVRSSSDWDRETAIQTQLLPIAAHTDEFADLTECWNERDYQKAEEYMRLMAAGVVFPPLVVSCVRGLLTDGYHRWWALRNLGITHYTMVVLDTYWLLWD